MRTAARGRKIATGRGTFVPEAGGLPLPAGHCFFVEEGAAVRPEDFAAIARASAPDLEILELSLPTATAQQAADAVGCDVAQICKSLLFTADDAPVLVLMRGDRRVSTERLREALQAERVRRADPDLVKAVTGYAIGGVPPYGHAHPLRTVFDACLLEHKEIYAAAGGPNALFRVDPRRLLEISRADCRCVCET